MILQIVCYKKYTQTVSLLNDFGCVLLDPFYIQNICRILRTCIYLCEYSYESTRLPKTNNVSRTECMNTSFLQSDVFDELLKSFSQHTNTALTCRHVNVQCDHWYQLQSLLHTNFHLHNMHNKVRYS